MTSPVDIRPDHLEIVQGILREHLPLGVKVWVFGSRANWNTKDSSDLDLALESERKLSHRLLGQLKDAFEVSMLPFTVDVVDLSRVGDSFRRIVESQRAPLALDGHGTARQVRVADHLSGETATGKGGLTATSIQRRESPFAQLLVEPVRNGIYKKKEFHGRGVKIVNMGELFANPRLRDVHMRRVELSELEQHRFGVQAGDLLFARRSLVAEGAGKCCVVLEINEPTAFESSIIRARPDPKKTDSLFLYYYFNSPLGLHALDTIRRQVAVAGITGTDLAQLPLEVPPLPEQQAIAHVLGTLDDKIELNRRMNETLEAMARALFKSWFVDFEPVRAKMEGHWRRGESLPGLPSDHYDLFPNRLVDSELGKIPEGWEVKPLGKLVKLNPTEPMKRGSLTPYLDMAALPTSGSSPDKTVLREFKSGTRFRNDDTLLARITPCLENGKTAYVQSLPRGTVGWGSTEFIILRAIPPMPPEYTYLLARNATFREHAIQSMTGTSGRQRVQVDALAPYLLPYPPAETWNEFSALVNPAFAQIESNRMESLALAAQRDALLPRLVSGHVRL